MYRVVVALALTVLASPAIAQGTTLVAGVADAESGAALEGALVRLPDFGLTTRTDAMGRARIAGVHSGVWMVEVRRLGYAPLRVQLAFSGKDSLDAVLMMARTNDLLDTVRVVAERIPPRLRTFEYRRANGLGRYQTRQQLLLAHANRDLADVAPLLFPGVRRGGNGAAPVLYGVRGPNCPLTVFIDGVRLPPDDNIGWVRTNDIAGIEYYTGLTAPPQFRGGGCGTLLLWLHW